MESGSSYSPIFWIFLDSRHLTSPLAEISSIIVSFYGNSRSTLFPHSRFSPILTPLSSSSRNFLVPSQLPAENTRRIVFRQLFLIANQTISNAFLVLTIVGTKPLCVLMVESHTCQTCVSFPLLPLAIIFSPLSILPCSPSSFSLALAESETKEEGGKK